MAMNEGVGVNSPQYSAVFYFLGRYKLLTGSILALILTSSVLESLSVAAFLPQYSRPFWGAPTNGWAGLSASSRR